MGNLDVRKWDVVSGPPVGPSRFRQMAVGRTARRQRGGLVPCGTGPVRRVRRIRQRQPFDQLLLPCAAGKNAKAQQRCISMPPGEHRRRVTFEQNTRVSRACISQAFVELEVNGCFRVLHGTKVKAQERCAFTRSGEHHRRVTFEQNARVSRTLRDASSAVRHEVPTAAHREIRNVASPTNPRATSPGRLIPLRFYCPCTPCTIGRTGA